MFLGVKNVFLGQIRPIYPFLEKKIFFDFLTYGHVPLPLENGQKWTVFWTQLREVMSNFDFEGFIRFLDPTNGSGFAPHF